MDGVLPMAIIIGVLAKWVDYHNAEYITKYMVENGDSIRARLIDRWRYNKGRRVIDNFE